MVSRKIPKRKTINTDLEVGVMWHGHGYSKVAIYLSTEESSDLDIGTHEVEVEQDDDGFDIEHERADVNLAIDDAIDNLSLMIARLQKLRKLKDNDRDYVLEKVNALRTFSTGITTKAKNK